MDIVALFTRLQQEMASGAGVSVFGIAPNRTISVIRPGQPQILSHRETDAGKFEALRPK